MNFEELYEKYTNGTATDEEKAFVESEIQKAKKLAEIIDEQNSKRVIEEAREETVKKSLKSFMRHTKRRVALIVGLSLILLIAFSVGGFFGLAAIQANNNSVCDKYEAVELTKRWMYKTHEDIDFTKLRVLEVDSELALHHGFSKAFFEYDVELEYDGVEYEFKINSSTGEVWLDDRD